MITPIVDIVKELRDPIKRKLFVEKSKGGIYARIRCLSKRCAGSVIGFMTKKKEFIEYSDSEINPATRRPYSGLLRARKRLDHVYGFMCRCGNSSFYAPEELGIIDRTAFPEAEDINAVASRLSKRSKFYTEKKFIIEEL